jgi:hypothetical protein
MHPRAALVHRQPVCPVIRAGPSHDEPGTPTRRSPTRACLATALLTGPHVRPQNDRATLDQLAAHEVSRGAKAALKQPLFIRLPKNITTEELGRYCEDSPDTSRGEKTLTDFSCSVVPTNPHRRQLQANPHAPCAGYEPSRQVVLVRASRLLTKEQGENVCLLASQLAGYADVWVLFDEESQASAGRSADEFWVSEEGREKEKEVEEQLRLFQANSPVPLHILAYDRVDQYKMWPLAWKALSGWAPNYWVHDFSIAFWNRLCGKGGGVYGASSRPFAVWILETDAAFSGNLLDFVKFYEDKSEDYICSHYGLANDTYPRGGDVYMKDPPTGLDGEFELKSVWWKQEHVERYSSRLMYHQELLISGGHRMFGESWAITSCKVAFNDWCTVRSFRDDNFTG